MAKVEPFIGLHYNPEIISDFSGVVCPPYDVIDAQAQEEYYQKHPYNIIRLILGKEFASDKEGEDKYTRAAGYLREWQRRNILVQEKDPSLYFYEQMFFCEGREKKRVGFIGLLRLDDEGGEKNVYPHEHTHIVPKEDRFRLIKSVEANLSPIFTIFSDPVCVIRGLFDRDFKGQPAFLEAQEPSGVENRIWRVAEKAVIDKIKDFLSTERVFIADGHHRYEVAKMYRDHKRRQDPQHFRDSYNFILAYFTALEDEGLCILPTHRLIRNAKLDFESFAPCFTVREVASRQDLEAQMGAKKDETGVFGLYKDKRFYLLKLSEKRECNRFIGEGPKVYRNLDVVILHKVIFDRLLDINPNLVSYEVSLDRAVSLADGHGEACVFILNPTKTQQVRAIALGGEVMPQKSTYFYPKLLSGLVIHKF